ncbi:hypothetical protein [Winogradskyella vidalii]|uniref:hypothetical protein n=1 Tax=Winogradskyella vidalii TaxID=2615024 RepID=UPI0015CD77A7|nr:hypothetical protein [Winogradskyella vidalii]
MKNKFIKYWLCTVALSLLAYNCNKDEDASFSDNGQTALSFEDTAFNLSIPEEDLVLEIPVYVTTLSSTDRSFDVEITSATEDTSNEYSVGTVVIPADNYSGVLNVDFDFSEISGEDGEVKDLILTIIPDEGTASYNDVVSISYFREIICNDLTLDIVSDIYAAETYFTVESADGTIIVDRFFPFTVNSLTAQEYSVTFNLPDGDYLLKIGDSYGDGMYAVNGDVTLTGSYSLTCSIITHASGEGTFDTPVPDPFTGNPGAEVEVTAFTVNP